MRRKVARGSREKSSRRYSASHRTAKCSHPVSVAAFGRAFRTPPACGGGRRRRPRCWRVFGRRPAAGRRRSRRSSAAEFWSAARRTALRPASAAPTASPARPTRSATASPSTRPSRGRWPDAQLPPKSLICRNRWRIRCDFERLALDRRMRWPPSRPRIALWCRRVGPRRHDW